MARRVSERRVSRTSAVLAVVAHPTVQIVRFLAKVALAWFVAPDVFGEVAFAGLVAWGLGHVVTLGLDETIVIAPRMDGRRIARFRRLHHVAGLTGAAIVAALAWPLYGLADYPALSTFLLVVAPTVWLSNLSVLPTARLVRSQRFRDLYLVDVAGVGALSVTLVTAAAAGAGGWSLILAWYANALAQWTMSSHLARDLHVPGNATTEIDDRDLLRFGRHCAGSAVARFLVGHIDRLATMAGAGRRALGVYEPAAHIAFAPSYWVANLAERWLLPALADRSDGDADRVLAGALHGALVTLIPLHVALAAAAVPLVAIALPDTYADSAAILGWLAFAAGARCVELTATTGLKARERGRAVSRLAAAKLTLLVGGVLLAMDDGAIAIARTVAIVSAADAILSTITVAAPQIRTFWVTLLRGAVCAVVWAAGFSFAVEAIVRAVNPSPLLHLGLLGVLGTGTWIVVRVGLDGERLRADAGKLRSWLRR
ncbi:MAG: hypothetical protein CMJ83_18265 [Planctomycetes bacterium]|nr:hypothetical protein [Planctomycetota bacterium]